MNTESCIKSCNKLLRGELSAIETYTQAINKLSGSARIDPLEQILSDHRDSAELLRDHIVEMGAVPETDSGAWGNFAKAVEGTAELMGDSLTLLVLQEGEEHGISEYQEALASTDVMEEAKATIGEILLPRLLEHLSVLENLRAA